MSARWAVYMESGAYSDWTAVLLGAFDQHSDAQTFASDCVGRVVGEYDLGYPLLDKVEAQVWNHTMEHMEYRRDVVYAADFKATEKGTGWAEFSYWRVHVMGVPGVVR